MNRSSVVALGLVAAFLVACSSGEKAADTTSASPVATPAPAAGATSTPAPGGTTHVVEMITDGTGSYFKPSSLDVKRGDVVRYTLTSGVHNVDFFPDSNPRWKGAPLVSDMLQLPGQTFDVPVNFAPGKYYFHCDPHAALGMIGHLVVAE
jgi:plastocyanin